MCTVRANVYALVPIPLLAFDVRSVHIFSAFRVTFHLWEVIQTEQGARSPEKGLHRNMALCNLFGP